MPHSFVLYHQPSVRLHQFQMIGVLVLLQFYVYLLSRFPSLIEQLIYSTNLSDVRSQSLFVDITQHLEKRQEVAFACSIRTYQEIDRVQLNFLLLERLISKYAN